MSVQWESSCAEGFPWLLWRLAFLGQWSHSPNRAALKYYNCVSAVFSLINTSVMCWKDLFLGPVCLKMLHFWFSVIFVPKPAVRLCDNLVVTKKMFILHWMSNLQLFSSVQFFFIVFPNLYMFGHICIVLKRLLKKQFCSGFVLVCLEVWFLFLLSYYSLIFWLVYYFRCQNFKFFWSPFFGFFLMAVKLVQPLENTKG